MAVADELIARQLQRTRSIHSLRTLSRQRTHRSHPVQQPPIHDDQIAWLIVDRDQTISQEQSATAPRVGWVRVVDGERSERRVNYTMCSMQMESLATSSNWTCFWKRLTGQTQLQCPVARWCYSKLRNCNYNPRFQNYNPGRPELQSLL